MQLRNIVLEGTPIEFTVRRYKRAKNIRVTIHRDVRIVVSIPHWTPDSLVDDFLMRKAAWILTTKEKLQSIRKTLPRSVGSYEQLKEDAHRIISARASLHCEQYGVTYCKLSVKNQQTKWGSCSGRKNLNFNYRAAFLPLPLLNYIVVHEVCHLQEMNHSPRFWQLVAQAIPDYLLLRRELRRHELREMI